MVSKPFLQYFILFINDFTMMWGSFLREKFEAFDKFNIFKAKFENELGVRKNILRYDRSGDFTSNQFNASCEDNGIYMYTLTPKTPQQNGMEERRNITKNETIRVILLDGKVSHVHWG